jgi:hypothetical protein
MWYSSPASIMFELNQYLGKRVRVTMSTTGITYRRGTLKKVFIDGVVLETADGSKGLHLFLASIASIEEIDE